MAVRFLEAVIMEQKKPASPFHAGMILIEKKGSVCPADRSKHDLSDLYGIASDDSAMNGNTCIFIDPVGNTFINANGMLSTTLDPLNASSLSSYYCAAKRHLSSMHYPVDYVCSSSLINILKFHSKSVNFITDQYLSKHQTDGIYKDYSVSQNLEAGCLLTYGANENSGKFVVISPKDFEKIVPIAKVINYDVTVGLIAVSLMSFPPNKREIALANFADTTKLIISQLITEDF